MEIIDSGSLIVTKQESIYSPSSVLIVIVVVPFDFGVTLPFWSTVAMEVLLDNQVTDLFVALDGDIV